MEARKSKVSRPIDITVGHNFRELRKQRGLSQMAVAECLDVSFQQIQKYEKGSNRISAGVLWELSLMLNVPVRAFFNGLEASASNNAEAPEAVPLISTDAYRIAIAVERSPNKKIKKAIMNLLESISHFEGEIFEAAE